MRMLRAENPQISTLSDFHVATNECERSLCAAVVPYFLSRAVEVWALAMLSNNSHKLWILERLSGVFEVSEILLDSRYIALSCAL